MWSTFCTEYSYLGLRWLKKDCSYYFKQPTTVYEFISVISMAHNLFFNYASLKGLKKNISLKKNEELIFWSTDQNYNTICYAHVVWKLFMLFIISIPSLQYLNSTLGWELLW